MSDVTAPFTNNNLSDIPFTLIDSKLQIRFFNDKFCELFGLETGRFRQLWDIVPECTFDIISNCVLSAKSVVISSSLQGSKNTLHTYICPVCGPPCSCVLFFIETHDDSALDAFSLWESVSSSELITLLSTLEKSVSIKNIRLLRKQLSHLLVLLGKLPGPNTSHNVDLGNYIQYISGVIASVAGRDTVHFNFTAYDGRAVSSVPFEVLDFILCNITTLTVRYSEKTVEIEVAFDSAHGHNTVLITARGTALPEPDRYQLMTILISRMLTPFGAAVTGLCNDTQGACFLLDFEAVTDTGSTLFTPPVFDYTDEFSLIRTQLADIL